MSSYYQVYRQREIHETDELTDQELEQVAGGFTPVPIPSAGVVQSKPGLTQIKLAPSLLQNINIQNTLTLGR